MTSEKKILEPIIRGIESRLSGYYNLDTSIHAADFLMPGIKEGADAPPGGRMLVFHDQELFIGIEFNTKTTENLADFTLEAGVNTNQLAALLVVIEEVSHFHLLIQRTRAGLETSQLELEWQAEVDKLVVLAYFNGVPAPANILHQLHATLVHSFKLRPELSEEERHRYLEATHYFDQLWKKRLLPMINSSEPSSLTPLDHPQVRKHLRMLYWQSWRGKLETLAA
jgi:hypothetical protein